MINPVLLEGLKASRDSKKASLESTARLSKDSVGAIRQGDDDDLPGTRLEDGEPRVSVLLVKHANLSEGRYVTIHDEIVDARNYRSKRETVAAIMRATVAVAKSQAPTTTQADLEPLSSFVYLGWRDKTTGLIKDEDMSYRLGVVRPGGAVTDWKGNPLGNNASYRPDEGYTYQKKKWRQAR